MIFYHKKDDISCHGFNFAHIKHAKKLLPNMCHNLCKEEAYFMLDLFTSFSLDHLFSSVEAEIS